MPFHLHPQTVRAGWIKACAWTGWILSGCGAGDAGTRDIGDADLLIENVTVIPMTADGRPEENRTVAVRDGVIVAVSPSGEIAAPEDAIRIPGEGRYLIPGLADMHVHVTGENELRLYVANGITTVRNMWGSPHTLAMRARSEAGAIEAPRMVTAGNVFDGDPPIRGWSAIVRSPEEARRLMDEEKAAGFDFVKTYERLSLEVFDAIASHAAEIGFPFAGHVPQSVSIDHALASGMASISHLSGWPTPGRELGPSEGEALLREIAAGEASWDEMFDPVHRREIAAAAAAAGVWHVPTLVYDERIYTSRRQTEGWLDRPEMRYVNPRVRAGWNPARNPRMAHMADDRLETIQSLLEESKRRVGVLDALGGRILAGTDAPNPFVPHGFALHDELQLLVDAGLTPYEALASATRGPAEFLGDPDGGTIEVGRTADLVLLGADPTQDIAATRSIEGVVLRGRWLPRAQLDTILAEVARAYDPPGAWFEGSGAFEPPGEGPVHTFETTDRGYRIGVERSATVPEGAPTRPVVYARRSTIAESGDPLVETVLGTLDVTRGFVELAYEQSSPSGTAAANARVVGRRLTVTGRTVAGSSIGDSVTLEPGEVVSCELLACLHPILDRIDDLEAGETRRIQVRRLTAAVRNRGAPSGDPRFVREAWAVDREEDDGNARSYRAVVTRGAYDWVLGIRVDATGLLEVRVLDDPRSYRSSRIR